MKKRQIRALAWAACALSIAVLAVVSCNTVPLDERAFQAAQRTGGANAYLKFAQSFPESRHVPEARKRAAELQEKEELLDFERVKDAKKASTLERFVAYHKDNPKVVVLAKLRIAEVDFDDLRKNNPFRPARLANQSWPGFLEQYAFGKYIPVPEDAKMRQTYYDKLHPLLLHALEQVKSFAVWEKYLKRFPDGPYFNDAAERLETYLISQSGEWDGWDMLEGYLALYKTDLKRPCPNEDELIRKFHEGLAKAVIAANTIPEYTRYQEMFPKSAVLNKVTHGMLRKQLADQILRSDRTKLVSLAEKLEALKLDEAEPDIRRAKARIQTLDYEDAEEKRTPQAMKAFVAQYADDDFAELIPKAKNLLRQMHDQMLARAVRVKRSDRFREFLAAFPESEKRAEAEGLLEKAEFNEALDDKTTHTIVKLLERYPSSPFRERALDRIEELEFQAARTAAESAPSTAPLNRYLQQYPKGHFAKEAEDLRDRITRDYMEFLEQLNTAYERQRFDRFSNWIVAARKSNNYFASRRGMQALADLRRDLDIRALEEAIITEPTGQTRRSTAAAGVRTLDQYSKMIAYVNTDTGSGTGFFFSRESRGGLLLTNARIARNANRRTITATLPKEQPTPCQLLGMGRSENLDAAVFHVSGTVNTIPMGNSAALAENENVKCLSARRTRIQMFDGAFFGTRKAGNREWLVLKIDEEKLPIHLGGVVLNRKAEAVGLLVHPDQVDASAKDSSPNHYYALSLRSALPVMKSGIHVAYKNQEQ